MGDFYTNVIQHGNQLLVREFDKGKRVNRRVSYNPTLFVSTPRKSKWKTLDGRNIDSVPFKSIRDAKEFINMHQDTPDVLYGLDSFQYVYIGDQYPDFVNWDINKLLIITLDIEVESENGFPDAQKAEEKLLCITVKNHSNKAIIVWGIGPYENDDVMYIECKNELDLVKKFIQFWSKTQPDIVTGWNVQFFDIPYLCNRITRLLGEKEVKKLSPWGIVKDDTIKNTQFGKAQQKYNLLGISVLDYLDLYRKFTYVRQESYRLDYIAQVELGERKDGNPFETFRECYTKDYKSFVDYNVQDVELVDRLEDKMKLIELCLTMAYEAKINYVDVYSPIRMWDILIYNFLKERKIIIPRKKPSRKDDKYEGAYVKDPQTGLHHWVMSFDLNSLYPHLIMQYNISPETVAVEGNGDVSIEKMLNKEVDIPNDGHTVTPNGARFRTDTQGFLPHLMETMYNDRVKFKNWALEAKQKFEDTKDKRYQNEISKYNNIQMARKIALNSAYGAIGNQYFRYYDERIATAITTSGQLSIKWIENRVNNYLNDILKTEDVDYIIASDTDSIYVRFDDLINKIQPKNPVDFLDKVAKEKIEPYITKCYEELAEYVNAYQQKMEMAREVIADKGIWTAKKRYILNVHDSEGVRFAEPEIKVMGIEAVKSSTPAPCREMIKSALKIIINEDEKSLNTFIQAFRDNFMKYDPEVIAYPRSCNNLRHYSSSSTIFIKGTPMHVKGALVYNYILKRDKLTNKYPLIQEGDKIKFLEIRTPNAYQSNVISFMTRLPKEFGLHNMVDYDIMFDKSFVEPLTFILDQIGWNVDRSYGTQTTLEHLFA